MAFYPAVSSLSDEAIITQAFSAVTALVAAFMDRLQELYSCDLRRPAHRVSAIHDRFHHRSPEPAKTLRHVNGFINV